MQHLEENVIRVVGAVRAALLRAGRKANSVKIVAVSKGRPVSEILTVGNLLESHGFHPIIGESYIQEFREKSKLLPTAWQYHLVGRLQRNKSREALQLFQVIQSVHSVELAQALQREAKRLDVWREIFLQINVSGDADKQGISPEGLREFLTSVHASCERLQVTGVMTITREYPRAEDARADFALLARSATLLCETPDTAKLLHNGTCEVSMGMSSDFEVACEEGATLVRIGTGLFDVR